MGNPFAAQSYDAIFEIFFRKSGRNLLEFSTSKLVSVKESVFDIQAIQPTHMCDHSIKTKITHLRVYYFFCSMYKILLSSFLFKIFSLIRNFSF